MIKAILFDYGGVVSSGGAGTELSERLGANLGISQEQAHALLSPFNEYLRGQLDEDGLWEKMEAAYGKPIPVSARAIWNSWEASMSILPEMEELIRRLKAGGYTVGLLSNVIVPTAEDIKTHGGYDLFDFLVLSCDVGFAKPDPKIYELALQKLPGIKPQQIIFVDDQQRCLDPAEKLGLHTVLAKDPLQIATDINALLQVER